MSRVTYIYNLFVKYACKMEYNSNITLSKGRIKHFSQQVKSTEVLILKPLLLEKKSLYYSN